MATTSAGVFYVASQRECRRRLLPTLMQMPILLAIGIGMSLNNALAVIDALIGRSSEFVRTPKYNASGAGRAWRSHAATVRLPKRWTLPILELLMACYLIACIVLALNLNSTSVSIPFLALFAAGYFYIGLTSI